MKEEGMRYALVSHHVAQLALHIVMGRNVTEFHVQDVLVSANLVKFGIKTELLDP